MLRKIAALLFLVLMSIQVVRTAAVAVWTESNLPRAAVLWPEHPHVVGSVAMAEVGAAAATLQEPAKSTLERLRQLGSMMPLAPEPFLVEAAIAVRRSNYRRAEQLLVHARTRAPRSRAAHFLLADLYWRTNQIDRGLIELATFSRLVPGVAQQLAPSLASYAQTPGSLPQIKRILGLHPELGPPLLQQLAADPRNVDLVLDIATAAPGADSSGWRQAMLNSLVESGDYQRAHAVWARFSGVSSNAYRLLFNPRFEPSDAPPPFNWSVASASDGIAELSREGLRVLHFGRGDVTLARQLMLLRPGRYRFEAQLADRVGEGSNIFWSVSCVPSKQQLLNLPVAASPGTVAGEFVAPQTGCRAQWLDLKGLGQDVANKTELRIREVRVTDRGG